MKSKRTKNLTCYYCECPATSFEHVPPKCVFPERKDAFGVDLRKNLITVPSCDQHNIEKSGDDEFLMACITSTVGNNGAGFIQTNTKIRRAVSRSAGRLLDSILSDAKELNLSAPSGREFPVLVGRPDLPRLHRVLEHVARGLFFHASGHRFIGTCHIMPGFISFTDNRNLELMILLSEILIEQEQGCWPTYGDNPDVFSFQIGPLDQFDLVPMAMTFFRGSKLYVAFKPKGVKLPFRTLDQATSENPIKIEIKLTDA